MQAGLGLTGLGGSRFRSRGEALKGLLGALESLGRSGLRLGIQ